MKITYCSSKIHHLTNNSDKLYQIRVDKSNYFKILFDKSSPSTAYISIDVARNILLTVKNTSHQNFASGEKFTMMPRAGR